MEEEKKIEKEEGLFLYEDPEDLPEQEKMPKPRVTLIPFSLGDEWYAIGIENILEIIKASSITKVPNLPDFIPGVINIRGNITSVTDFKRLFGLAETSIIPGSHIIVIRASGKATGLIVDSVGKALSLLLDSIQPPLSTIPEIKADYIRGEAKLEDGRLLTILDMEKIMASEEMRFE